LPLARLGPTIGVMIPSSRSLVVGVALLLSCGGSAQNGGNDAGGGIGGKSLGTGTGGVGGAGGGNSGTDGGAACQTVAACGGNVVGTWQGTSACLSSTEDLSSTCAGASANIAFTFTGSVTFNADLTYSSASTASATTTYHYPAACLTAGTTCTQWGQLLMSIGMYSSVTSTTDGAGVCTCEAITAPTSSTESGTYSTSGGTLTTVHDGKTSAAPYCVQGNVLHEMPSIVDGGQTTGGIVLTKQ
jgi:hypothetical protein